MSADSALATPGSRDEVFEDELRESMHTVANVASILRVCLIASSAMEIAVERPDFVHEEVEGALIRRHRAVKP